MSSVNKVIILGNLGNTPELKYLPSGQAVCEMRIATSEVFKDKNDQRQERTEWHRVVAWGKLGGNAAKYLDKGRQVYIEGKLQTRSWDDKDGNRRYSTEIVATSVVFLRGGGGEDDRDRRPASQGRQQERWRRDEPAGPPPGGEDFGSGSSDDDLPF